MKKQTYKSPKVKEIDLAIRRGVCQQMSSDVINAYGSATFGDSGDDFKDLDLDDLFNNW